MLTPNQCKTQRCTRNSIPESFGFCNICFAKIIEIRKVKALESIAKSLKQLNFPEIIHTKETRTINQPNDSLPLKKKKKKAIIHNDDFIPSMDISKIQPTNIKIETKTSSKNLSEINKKLQNL